MARIINEQCFELTWDELSEGFTRFGVLDYCTDVKGKVLEHMLADLQIIGTRYYVHFENFEDAIWFRLKYL